MNQEKAWFVITYLKCKVHKTARIFELKASSGAQPSTTCTQLKLVNKFGNLNNITLRHWEFVQFDLRYI